VYKGPKNKHVYGIHRGKNIGKKCGSCRCYQWSFEEFSPRIGTESGRKYGSRDYNEDNNQQPNNSTIQEYAESGRKSKF
jgi:hypothetical protein